MCHSTFILEESSTKGTKWKIIVVIISTKVLKGVVERRLGLSYDYVVIAWGLGGKKEAYKRFSGLSLKHWFLCTERKAFPSNCITEKNGCVFSKKHITNVQKCSEANRRAGRFPSMTAREKERERERKQPERERETV